MQIELDNNIITVEIIRKNNKNIYFRFKDDLKLYVSCNKFVSKNKIIELVNANKKSILKMYEHAKKLNEVKNDFYYLGDKYEIGYQNDVKKIYFDNNKIFTKDDKMLNDFLKGECQKIFLKRVNDLSHLFNDLPDFKVKIRSMKTRWGVCNKSNNTITLNSELIKKETTLLDYVIIHELCHFKHPNHSKAFWNEVSIYYPYYKLARKKLREV